MNFVSCEKPGVVECFALVKSCDKKTAKNGSSYLDMLLADKDGEMYAKLWDYREDVLPLPQVNTVIKVRGTLQQYNGNDQMIVQKIRAAAPSDNINISDFVKSSDYSGEVMFNTVYSLAEGFADSELKAVVTAMLNDNKEKLLFFPAAEKLHHAMTGGLLYHTLSIIRLCECVCAIYPCVDRELLVAGAILHDIAKIKEYTVNETGIINGHTVEGVLLGHLVMGAEDVGRKCDMLGVNEKTKFLLQHMLISHHGKPEFGCAVRPAFIEAEVLSQLDMFDANMYEMADAVKDAPVGDFTGRLWMLDNRRFLNHGRKAVEPQANIIDEESAE